MNDYKIIKSVEEITEVDVLNRVQFSTKHNKNEYFRIDKSEEVYMIDGHVCGDMPTSVCVGTYVQTWKSLNAVKRAIKRFSKNGNWGFFKFFPEEK
jgi:hypothetical protein